MQHSVPAHTIKQVVTIFTSIASEVCVRILEEHLLHYLSNVKIVFDLLQDLSVYNGVKNHDHQPNFTLVCVENRVDCRPTIFATSSTTNSRSTAIPFLRTTLSRAIPRFSESIPTTFTSSERATILKLPPSIRILRPSNRQRERIFQRNAMPSAISSTVWTITPFPLCVLSGTTHRKTCFRFACTTTITC